LECRAERDGQRNARVKRHDRLQLRPLSPHLAAPADHEPDFLDAAVRDRARCLACGELEMCQAAASQRKQRPNVGTVRSFDERRVA